ncbi:MAG: hypothetical protein AAF938_19775 [Myxococcota bacterium]
MKLGGIKGWLNVFRHRYVGEGRLHPPRAYTLGAFTVATYLMVQAPAVLTGSAPPYAYLVFFLALALLSLPVSRCPSVVRRGDELHVRGMMQSLFLNVHEVSAVAVRPRGRSFVVELAGPQPVRVGGALSKLDAKRVAADLRTLLHEGRIEAAGEGNYRQIRVGFRKQDEEAQVEDVPNEVGVGGAAAD